MDKNLFAISKLIFINLAFAVGYAVAGRFFETYATLGGIVSAVYPPSGMAVIAVLLGGYSLLPGIWLGDFLMVITLTHNVPMALVGCTGVLYQTFISVWIIQKLTHTKTPFYRVYDVGVFVFGGAFLPCLLSSGVGTLFLYHYGYITASQYYVAWLDWWTSDAIGIITLVPLVMSWYQVKVSFSLKQILELVLLVVLCAFTAWLEYTFNWPIWLLLLYCIWATVRFGAKISFLLCFLLSSLVFYLALHGYKQFLSVNMNATMLFVQSFIALTFFTTLILVAILAERDKSAKELVQANKNLEKRVIQRTQDLHDRNIELNSALQELKTTQTQLVQAEKMSALGVLTAGIAHEINNAVNFIAANITPLKYDIADLMLVLKKYMGITSAKQIETKLAELSNVRKEINIEQTIQEIELLLAGIQNGAQRTTTIVKDLRTFSRLDEDMFKLINIHQDIDSTLNLLKNHYKDKITIIKNYGKDVPEIECCPGKINQVIMSLLTNAIQAIPDKGEIVITTTKENDQVIISIKDNGIGMSEEVQARIFEPFFTTKDVGKGTGLGLSISYSIIQEHHGSITVLSSPGKGTEFLVQLVMTKKEPE